MANDLVLRGGTLIDGTGAPPRVGDLAIRAGRIAELGEVADAGSPSLDARGCWVTPGFIDPHTHLDAQLCWDASGSPSNRHGVTSVVLGLCGFGVAPCPEDGGEYLLRSLEMVEEIPYDSTRLGVPFSWRSWREFRDHLAQRPLGVNAAGFVPHSALRYFAMGDRARSEPASPEELTAMIAELEDALAAGAVGLATSRGPNHVDGYQQPVPSRLADPREIQALVRICRDRIWQINVETKFSHDAEALTREVATYADWSRSAGARLTWTPFYAEPGETVWQEVLAHNRALNASGVSVAPQITAVPITLLLRFDERSFLTAVSGWEKALRGFFRLDPAGKAARLADPQVRAALKQGGGDPKNPLTPDFGRWTFTVTASRPELAGLTLEEAGRRSGTHPVDLLCDQAIADEMATLVDVPVLNRSVEGAVHFLKDSGTLLGLGDSGAHVMSVTNYRYPTFLLAELVVKQEALTPELAINRLTRVPARMHGLRDRGELTAGAPADVCVIDPERLALGAPAVQHDLPGGAPRLVQPGFGYRAVLVNGVQTIENDTPTGATPGRFLRSET
jgi:N-acyl-D-aspartate/D-glutamate deacylase